MKFPPATKAVFLATLALVPPSTAFNPAMSSLSSNSCSAPHSPTAVAVATEETAVAETSSSSSSPQEIFRIDYKPLPYRVSNVSMNFDIRDGKTVVER